MSVEIVAEVGICHRGSLNEALRMMGVAAACGCDTVKFQTRNPRLSVPKSQWDVVKQTPFWADQGITELPYIEYKEKLEIPHHQYQFIDRWAKLLQIKWATSFWDIETLNEFAPNWELPWIKVPSAHLTNLQLIKAAAKMCLRKEIPLYISTGMSTRHEIDTAVHTALENGTHRDNLVLFHCNSAYPTPVDEVNLNRIKTMKDRYGCKIGYSGHEETILTSCAAVCAGAEVIEKHITLDHNGGATDDSVALEPIGISKWVKGIRDLEQAMGDGEIKVFDSELPFKEKLRG